jgi:hypothetical protein
VIPHRIEALGKRSLLAGVMEQIFDPVKERGAATENNLKDITHFPKRRSCKGLKIVAFLDASTACARHTPSRCAAP